MDHKSHYSHHFSYFSSALLVLVLGGKASRLRRVCQGHSRTQAETRNSQEGRHVLFSLSLSLPEYHTKAP